MPKFLVDECLSLDLVEVARSRGFAESSHVVWMGKAGWKDWELKPFILAGDWTFGPSLRETASTFVDLPGSPAPAASTPTSSSMPD